MTNVRGIKETIVNARKEKGYTQSEMAKKLKISQPAYSYYEKSDKPLPINQFKKVVEILDLKPETLETASKDSLSEINSSLIRVGDLLEKILDKM